MVTSKSLFIKKGLIVFVILGLFFFNINLVSAATPIIYSGTIYVINIIGPGAQITWTTDIPSDSMVVYGTSANPYAHTSTSRCDAGGMVTNHCVNLMDLSISTIYYYIVKSADSSGVYSSSPAYNFTSASSSTTTTTIPTMPTSLRGTGSTETSISLIWNDNSSNEDKFNLERKLSSSNAYSLVIQTSGNVTTYTDYSVTAGTSYDYRIQACLSGSGCSEYSYVYGLYTTSTATATTDITPPSYPSPSLFLTSSNNITLQWTAPGDDGATVGTVSGYEIRYSTTPQGTMTLDQWWSQATTSSDVIYDPSAFVSNGSTQKVNIYGLYPSITYYFAIKAKDEVSNWSSPSGIISATTLSGTQATNTYSPPVPSTPTGSISGTANTSYAFSTYLYPDSNGDQVKAIFDWGDGTTSYTSYTYPATGGSSSSLNHTWTAAGTYYVKVKAQDYGGLESGWSGTLTVSISAAPVTDNLPDLTISDIYLGPNIAVSGSTATDVLSIKMSNVGATAAPETGKLHIWIDGILKWTYSFSTLADKSFLNPGGITIGQPQTLSGTHTVKATIDYYNVITESNENNNTFEKTLSATTIITSTNPPVPSTPTGSISGTANTSYAFSTYLYPDSNGDQVKAIFDWGDGTTSYTSYTYPATGGSSSSLNHTWTVAGTYYIKAKAQDYGGLESGWSGTLTVSISAAPVIVTTTIPTMPTSLRGTGSTETSISLIWNDNSSNEDKFNLERKLSSSNAYSLVIQTSGNVTTYTDYSVAVGTSYDYRIQACLSGSGCSEYSYVYGLSTISSGNITTTTAIKIIKGKITYSDGKAVTNAGIGAYNSTSGLWTNVYSDSSGNYTIKVSGGKWQVGIYPSTISSQIPDWTYTKTPAIISFADDSTIPEEITLNFQVEATQSSINGYILKHDSMPPSSGMAGIRLKDAYGYEHKTYIDQNGYFFIYLISGTYTVQIFSLDSQFGSPSSFTLSINQGEQKDLGKLYLTSNIEKIEGKVTDENGAGIGNVWINANEYLDNKFVQVKTVSDGSYELWVSPGEWELNVYPDSATGYYYTQGYKKVIVNPGQTTEVNFSLSSTASQIYGNIADSSGQILTDVYGSVYAGNFSGPIEKGAFNFKISPGTYTLYVYLPSDSKYSPPSSQTITISSGESKKINLTVSTLNTTIYGSLKDSSGNLITNLSSDKIKIYVSAKNGAWYNALVNPSQGSYSVGVASDIWYLNYWVDSSSGYSTTEIHKEIDVSATQSYKSDIILAKSDSFISGSTKSSDGKALPGVWISVDTTNLTGAITTETTIKSIFAAGDNSDANGNFKIAVPAGIYYIHSYYSPTFGYINPPEIKIEVLAGKTASVDLIFKKPEIKITGSISIDGIKKSAFIWAWGESGGYAETRSDDNGFYSLNVSPNNKWHISSSAEINGVYHKSADIVVNVENQTPPASDIVLMPVYTFAQAIEKIVEAAAPQSVALTDGAKIILPANSLATTGNVNVSLKPVAEAPSFGNTSVVGSSYEVKAQDTSGQSISNLNSEITITIPYNDDDLATKGLEPEDLTLSFLDETTSSWKSLEKQVIDKNSKVVSGAVNHLTRFALVAPADTIPPSSPSSIKTSILTDKTIKIAWVNPKLDFSHVRIYRSEKSGELGSLAYGNITEESQIDNKVSLSKTYYYTIRAVDLAGNESSNTGQVSPTTTTAATTAPAAATSVSFKFTKSLYKGLVDNEVKKMQELLAKDKNIYPEGVISGYFGSLTEAAVKKFQTKYGITESLGVVGTKTREQLNTLLGQEVKELVTGAFKFNKNLYKGLVDNEVKKMQELLAKDKAIYPEGVISGYFGSLTEAAVKRFQAKYGIEQVGIVGPKTRTKLNELYSK